MEQKLFWTWFGGDYSTIDKMAQILGIQIVGFLFGLFIIYYSFLNYKRKEFTIKELLFWVFLWVVFLILSLFPFILDPIIKPLGFFRAFDFFIMSGFLFLIVAIFYTYTITRKNQKRLETIVREMATRRNRGKWNFYF